MTNLAKRCCIVDCDNKYLAMGYCAGHYHLKHNERTHNMSKTSEYNSWKMMVYRCLTPSYKSYYRYGGRGIKVFPAWIESFSLFYAYMGDKPSPEYSIDRIDNDGNYEPGNVRWASPREQANNKGKKKRSNNNYVYFDKSDGKWRYSIYLNGKRKFVCGFNSEESALIARNKYIGTL